MTFRVTLGLFTATSLALIIFDNFSPEELITRVNDVVVHFELKHGQLSFFRGFKREAV